MALTQESLSNRIKGAFISAGADADNEHSWVSKMSDAIALAVVDEIQANAEVNISGGSSSGTYKVE